jgi:hypothetical protein
MKKLLLAALLLAVAGPAIADDYCSNHFCLTPPPLPPNIYVTPSDEAYFVNASTAVGAAFNAETLAQSFEDNERKAARVLHAELNALRVEVHRLESLLEAVRSATQSYRSKVIDGTTSSVVELPPWPRRTGRDVN